MPRNRVPPAQNVAYFAEVDGAGMKRGQNKAETEVTLATLKWNTPVLFSLLLTAV